MISPWITQRTGKALRFRVGDFNQVAVYSRIGYQNLQTYGCGAWRGKFTLFK